MTTVGGFYVSLTTAIALGVAVVFTAVGAVEVVAVAVAVTAVDAVKVVAVAVAVSAVGAVKVVAVAVAVTAVGAVEVVAVAVAVAALGVAVVVVPRVLIQVEATFRVYIRKTRCVGGKRRGRSLTFCTSRLKRHGQHHPLIREG